MNKDRIIDQHNEVYGSGQQKAIKDLLMNSDKEFLVNYLICLDQERERLEKELIFVDKVQTPDYEKVQEELWKYQKALDKACDLLANILNACCEPETDLMEDCGADCKSHWKEWCLKDE